MKIAVYDDQLDYQNLVEKKIKECLNDKNVKLEVFKFSIIEELIKSFRNHKYQFAYIEMTSNNHKGIEIAKLIQDECPLCQIVFISDQYRRIEETFHFNCSSYILKPFNTKIFNEVFHSMLKDYNKRNIKFILPIKGKIKKRVFSVDDIRYVITNYNDMEIVTTNDIHYFTNSVHRRILNEVLRPRWFLKINGSVLVNMKHIDIFTSKQIVMTTREVFLVGRLTVNENYLKYLEFKKENEEERKQL